MSTRVLALVLSALFAGAALAQPPTLVKDINTTQTGGTWQIWPSGTQFVEMGDALYFMSSDGIHGTELWRTDGTAAGTRLVKDICPGSCSSWIFRLSVWGPALYFSADDGAHGAELWKSDGTETGTVLVKDLQSGAGTSFPRPMGRIGNTVLLSADDAAHGVELWKFDGSPAGPTLVKDINPGTGGSLNDGWTDLPGYQAFLVSGSRLYFSATDGTSGHELWASDGTEAGTVLIKDINPGADGSQPFSLVELNGQLLFRAYDADHGYELWKSDGTGTNTVLVKDIRSGPESSFFYLSGFTMVGTTLTFFADDGTNGLEPWKSDGTEAGTMLLADLSSGAGSSMFDLYGPITDLRIVWGGRWYFRAFDSELDAEVYISDGTSAGTQQLVEINEQTSALQVELTGSIFSLKPLADRNGTLFFQASDGVSGTELWKSEGTEAGTEQVADIVPGTGSSVPSEITPLGGSVLFNAAGELWTSDGTEAGTSLLKDLNPQNLTPFGGQVFFTASTSGEDKLWRSDGTEAGTIPVRDIPPTALSPTQLTPVGNLLFYTGEGPGGYELWRTDGTAIGTVQVADIAPGSASSSPDGLIRVGSRVFFSADDGSSGRELWSSDGINTWRVRDILPGAGSSILQSWSFPPLAWATARGKLVFAATDGIAGEELWVSDGTEAGTFRLRDVFPGPRSSEIHGLTAAGERVYFVADDGTHGRELWVTDGNALGTRLLADLVPGEGSSLPEQLAAVGQNLVFSAHTPDHGREPWLTDGDAVGTRRLADLAPGPIPSSPISFTLSGPWLYFAATDAVTGFELYSTPREAVDGGLELYTVTPCRLVDTRLTGDPLLATEPRTFDVSGLCGIPETARALAVNVTVLADGHGDLVLYRATTALPVTTSISFVAGRYRTNNATVHLGGGAFTAAASPGSQTIHLIVDVTGYYE